MSQNTLPSPDYRLPCDVRLPGGMTLRRGCTFSALATALQRREGREGWQVNFDVPIPCDRSAISLWPLPASSTDQLPVGQPILLVELPAGIDSEGGSHD